jgi:hypothetical protein
MKLPRIPVTPIRRKIALSILSLPAFKEIKMKTKTLLALAAFISVQAYAATPAVPAGPAATAKTPVTSPATQRPSASGTGMANPVSTPAPVLGTTNPGLAIAHTKITKLEAPTSLKPGVPLVARVYGTGNEGECKTMVVVTRTDTPAPDARGPEQLGTGAWPRSSTFSLQPGRYTVSVQVIGKNPDDRKLCDGNAAIPGQDTVLYVGNDIAK